MERPSDFWSERPDRKAMRLAAAGFWPDGSSAVIFVTNLSYEGCEMQSAHAFERGVTIGLALPGRGRIPAQIRWVREGRAGAKFITGESARDIRRAKLGV